jgi:DNA invertase Pin-like site-specific DNA recombinase
MTTATGVKIGYARVSSRDQNLDSQIDMLQAAGCDRIFQEKVSGVREHRPEWDKLLEYVRPGDTIVVAELSRMTRSLMHLLKLTQELEAKGVSIASLREHIDTSTATGRAFVSIIGAINQMERELKAERAASGRAAAKARGRSGGRPSIPLDTMKNAMLIYKNSDKTAAEVCKMFSIGRRTLFGFIKQQEEAAKP